jgi:predicted nucleic acid-binding protein
MTGEAPERTGEPPRQGLLDTDILVLRRWIDPEELPDEMAISAITLAELSAGPHQVRPNGEQDLYDEHEERARRTESLQRAESEFDPVPFDAEAARVYGRVSAAVVAAGRKPRRRIADLMIAATAIAEDLPLFTTNPGDYAGLENLVRIVPVTRPLLPHEKNTGLCDQTVDERERLAEEVTLVPDDQRPAEVVEHRASLVSVAAELILDRVEEVQVADVCAYRFPLVAVLQNRFVPGVGPGGVTRHQDGLRHDDVEPFQDRKQQRSAARVPDQHGALVVRAGGEHLRQELGDRLDVNARVVRHFHGVTAVPQAPREPGIPDPFWPGAGAVEDDRVSTRHAVTLPREAIARVYYAGAAR